MFTLFVIGNIASGKSFACSYLEQCGGYRIDLDQMAKGLYDSDPYLLDQIASAFGDDIVDAGGSLNRHLLADRAFSSRDSIAKLNAIVHPVLLNRLGDILVPPQTCGPEHAAYSFFVVEISAAASFTAAIDLADDVIAVTAPLDVRRERAVQRGMSPDDFDARAAIQPTEEEISRLATIVIDNTAGDDGLLDQLDAVLRSHGVEPCRDRTERFDV